MPCGEGTMSDIDGEAYVGQFAAGVRSGKGVLTHTNGDVFEGIFVNGTRRWLEPPAVDPMYMPHAHQPRALCDPRLAGLRHGPGVQRTAGGTTYEGEWVHDTLGGQVVVLEGALFASSSDGRKMAEVPIGVRVGMTASSRKGSR